MEKIKTCPNCGAPGELFPAFVVCHNSACRLVGPNAENEEDAIRKWNALPRWDDMPDIHIHSGSLSTPIMIRNISTGQRFAVEAQSDTLVWDDWIDGRDWHTVFVFDGPRTYVVASLLDRQSAVFLGMARCNPKDTYNRYTGMREAMKQVYGNYVGKWRKPYLHAFRVWINQFDPVWPPKE